MCVDLELLQDGIVESVESLNVVLTSDTGITVGDSTVEVQIIDIDSKPIVIVRTNFLMTKTLSLIVCIATYVGLGTTIILYL